MSVMPEEEILRQFLRRYNQNPLEWRIYGGTSPAGYPEVLITNPGYSWLLKRDSQYSGMPGIGGRLEQCVSPKSISAQSGFRPISKYAMEKIVAMMEQGADPIEAMKIVETSLRQDPTTFDEIERIRPPGVLRGPIMLSHRPLQHIIGGQLDLDAKLEIELRKMQARRTGYIG